MASRKEVVVADNTAATFFLVFAVFEDVPRICPPAALIRPGHGFDNIAGLL